MSFKELDINGQKYKFDKLLIWSCLVIILIVGLYSVFISQGKLYAYSECPSNIVDGVEKGSKCFNVYYNSNLCNDGTITGDLCSIEVLNPGENVGDKAPFIVRNFFLISIIVLIVFLLINHFLYNKDFNFNKLEIGGD